MKVLADHNTKQEIDIAEPLQAYSKIKTQKLVTCHRPFYNDAIFQNGRHIEKHETEYVIASPPLKCFEWLYMVKNDTDSTLCHTQTVVRLQTQLAMR